MRSLRITIAFGVVLVLVVLTALIMGWPVERAVYLAPVIVVAVAALLGLWLGGILLLVLLTALGVELPREG